MGWSISSLRKGRRLRLDAEKLQAAKAEFELLEREGIVQCSTSPWASPLHMVMKKDGSWRPCGGFRCLNLVTQPDTYPLPNMLDFSARVAGCKVVLLPENLRTCFEPSVQAWILYKAP